MRRPRIAVNATVLAAAVGIDARLETNIRAFVMRDNGASEIPVKTCRQRWNLIVWPLIGIGIDAQGLEAVRRVSGRAAAVNRVGEWPFQDRLNHFVKTTQTTVRLAGFIFPR